MKLSKLATLFTCTSLLAFTLGAAPTNLRYIEFEDSETQVYVNQDENEMTQVTVRLDDEKHEFTFTPEELTHLDAIESRLTPLPEGSRKKLAKLLSRMSQGGEHEFHIIQAPELDPKLEKKIQALAKIMEGKEAEMKEMAIKLKAKVAKLEPVLEKELRALVAKIEGKQAEIEKMAIEIEANAAKLEPALEKELQAVAEKMEIKEAEIEKIAIKLEAKAAEIEAQAAELESVQELHEEEFDLVIEALEQHVSEIVSSVDDIDIDMDEIDTNAERIIIITGDEGDQVEHLIRVIKHSKLSDGEKQAIKEALN
ncbi:hypothetical protein [uncultured Shewanella sp.]|uniref:hypothetical protein n=1 Tax=uncultured Shewanella sp. TaxID=173975 RepID=UPI00260F9854|nr:hypothetical protein [uncultured Shewanella sp.]